MRVRAHFASVLRHTIVVVYDHSGRTGGVSVFDDARAVVAFCLHRHGNHRIIVRDTRGAWHELHHDGESFLQTAALAADYFERIADFCGIRP